MKHASPTKSHYFLPGIPFVWLVLSLGHLEVAAQPHSCRSVAVQPGGPATVTLAGKAPSAFRAYSELYPLEASTNLADWLLVASLQHTSSPLASLTFVDTNASEFNRRFYRTPSNVLVTPFPKPSGPFAVGTFSRVISDPARTNRYRYSNQTNAFMLTCWYPAQPQAGRLPAAAWDKQVAADSARYSEYAEDSGWANVVPQFSSHAWPGWPLVPGTNRFPIILYSHGYLCHRKSNCRDCEELASHGYVVVGADHEDCWGTEFPDARYLVSPYHASSSPPWAYLIGSRIKDLLCVVDELRRWGASDPGLAGRLDLDCLGTLAMSFGGSTTAVLSQTNDAVKCAAFLDCTFHLEINTQLNQIGFQKPLLAINNDYAAYPAFYFWPESTHLFDRAMTNAVIFQIHKSFHFSFFDFGWFFPVTEPWNPVMPGTTVAIDASLVSFFNKFLKAADDHFLDQPPSQYAEVVNFMKK
jgi:predicted dienelactone hydrolase